MRQTFGEHILSSFHSILLLYAYIYVLILTVYTQIYTTTKKTPFLHRRKCMFVRWLTLHYVCLYMYVYVCCLSAKKTLFYIQQNVALLFHMMRFEINALYIIYIQCTYMYIAPDVQYNESKSLAALVGHALARIRKNIGRVHEHKSIEFPSSYICTYRTYI